MASSQRLYLPAVEDTGEVEDREKYRPGGYHPIHFNDYLDSDQRFNVIHKLGWGTSSTVWLCLDKKSRYYKSVKVMTAEESIESCPELRIMEILSDVSRQELEDNYITIPHEYFWLQGPNGRHLCLVSDILGPSLFRNSPLGVGIYTPKVLTDLAFQVSKGLQYLHKKGICHGDLRPGNVLMQLHQYSLLEISDSQLDRYLGPREYEPLQTRSGANPMPHGPKYLALPASLDKLEAKCRTNQVALIDFSHSFCNSTPPVSSRWHRQYAGPELLFTKTLSGFPQDIWGLACTIYEIKLQTPLFSEYEDYSSLIRQMETWFGPLPVAYRQIASGHLERDRKRHLILSDEKSSSSSKSLISEDKLSDSSQPLSLAPDEEQRARDLIIGGTSWSNPLQAALGEEQRCYIHEKSYTGYTSSDETDSILSDSDTASQDSSSDAGSGVDVYVQSELYLWEIESPEERMSQYSDEKEQEEPSSSPSRIPINPVDPIEQSRDEKGSPEAESLIEVREVSPNNDTDENGAHQIESPLSPLESLEKRGGESSEERVAKRQRTGEGSSQERGKLVERAVRMPKEEVLLLSDLLLSMFKHDPKERIDIDAVVNHEYWGDRRNHRPTNNEDLGEDIPDPISSRTRSRVSKSQQQAEPGSP
ncbi:kinase-like domain-containing protein [Daldinia vernicosa]|uniref:kinase-like domain-containing protein n=1 Tax=Daldinia vernicosa TaxID=114800 RepID=UPI00200799DC|nr:kinase-like domain-containing protein [Daldinia vernicosa]KAI0852800.1 kinase-like domain-containing protein [Daldinia vernicosa]